MHTARFKLKESEKTYRHSNTGQASIAIERAVIVK